MPPQARPCPHDLPAPIIYLHAALSLSNCSTMASWTALIWASAAAFPSPLPLNNSSCPCNRSPIWSFCTVKTSLLFSSLFRMLSRSWSKAGLVDSLIFFTLSSKSASPDRGNQLSDTMYILNSPQRVIPADLFPVTTCPIAHAVTRVLQVLYCRSSTYPKNSIAWLTYQLQDNIFGLFVSQLKLTMS